MTLRDDLTAIKGVGEAASQKFALLGIRTVGDLLDYYPRRYEDYSHLSKLSELKPGIVSFRAKIISAVGHYVRRGMHITEAIAQDDEGSVRLVWFNQPYRAASIKSGQEYFIAGTYELKRRRFVVNNPSTELASDFPVNTARIIPVYKETKVLTSTQIRKALKSVFETIPRLPETLPVDVVSKEHLLPYHDALFAIHFPESNEQLDEARRRLGFEEVFQLSLASLLNKQENDSEATVAVPFDEQLARDFVSHLPFKLTDEQRRTIWQICLDLGRQEPMNRLVEGDVGSGKTVVAAMAAVMALKQGHQVALMAPTELLARQHADTIYRLLEPLGYGSTVCLLVGSMKQDQKVKAREAMASGQAGFIIGTQALIQDKIDMHKLVLVIVDEQHRFGVDQRKTLMIKAGHMPHFLALSATPIPRSLALTLYGELDVSIIAQKPPGRQPIITQLVSPNSRAPLYEQINAELDSGRQMFVVCPLIADSATIEASSAESVYEQLSKHDFKTRRIGLLHGKLKADEKNHIMGQFVRHELDILVSTTVIEVGVDVPNASIMLIEGPERFGLAQMHQLRGRVGRGEHAGYCYIMLSDSKAPSRRLRALESSNDGFKLAELDLELRGPGAIYGTLQHGALDLRIAKLSDTKLIVAARARAQALIDAKGDLLQYKQLMTHVTRLQAVTNLN